MLTSCVCWNLDGMTINRLCFSFITSPYSLFNFCCIFSISQYSFLKSCTSSPSRSKSSRSNHSNKGCRMICSESRLAGLRLEPIFLTGMIRCPETPKSKLQVHLLLMSWLFLETKIKMETIVHSMCWNY